MYAHDQWSKTITDDLSSLFDVVIYSAINLTIICRRLYIVGKWIFEHKSCSFTFKIIIQTDEHLSILSLSPPFFNHKAMYTSKLMIIQTPDWSLIFSTRRSIILIMIANGWSWPFSPFARPFLLLYDSI